MEKYYIDTNQISESYEGYTHKYPKYDKSTTDPTYYEPAATRIANMRKAAGVQLEGIYDYYTKDDVLKFNESNFSKNISNAYVDPRFNTKLLREEVSQITNDVSDSVEKMVSKKTEEVNSKNKRIKETVETQQLLNKYADNSADNNSSE